MFSVSKDMGKDLGCRPRPSLLGWSFFIFTMFYVSFVQASDFERVCAEAIAELRSSHPTTLLPNEQFIDNRRALELMEFEDDFWSIINAQRTLALSSAGERGRVFHRKTLGQPFLAYVEILPSVPKGLRRGFFEDVDTRRPAVVRFSGGMGQERPDWQPDATGFALKILDENLSDPSPEGAQIKTMDWTSTKGVSAFAADQRRFIEFMEAMLPGRHRLSRFLSYAYQQPKALTRVISASFRPYSSLLLQTYGLNHPYALDDTSAFRMRFHLNEDQPRLKNSLNPEVIRKQNGGISNLFKTLRAAALDRNYLGTNLNYWLAKGNIEFLGSLQVEDGRAETNLLSSIENGLSVWKTTPIPVIRIVFLTPQPNSNVATRLGQISWNPGNYLFNHRPVGRLGRGRAWTYRASQIGRDSVPESQLQQLYRDIAHEVRNQITH